MDIKMKRISICFVMMVLIAASACQKHGTDVDDQQDDEAVLQESDEILANPFKGFVPWIGSENTAYPTQLQYGNFTWKDLEPSPGVFNKARFEKDWGNITQTGRRVGFRVNACEPGERGHIDIPQWLADQGVPLRAYAIDGSYGLAPDWNDPRFLLAHHDFLMALGARYDADPRVAWIDIGSYGFWGEWHVYLNDSLAASQATRQAILEDYFTAFPTKPKVIAFDDDFATQYVTSRGGGIRNDCLGTSDSNDWYLTSLNGIDPGLNDRVWKTAIISGEFCGSDQGALQGTTNRFDLNYQFIQKTHWSFIGPAGGDLEPLDANHRKNLDRLYKKLGYRFVLHKAEFNASVKRGEKWVLQMQVENVGVAPFYFDWPLVIYLIDDAGIVAVQTILPEDIRGWLPGLNSFTASIPIAVDLTVGVYHVGIAIHDPITGKPGVRFANKNRDAQWRYLLGQVDVK